MKIAYKIALVTGGADGIGKAVSQRLLEQGAKFVAILDFNEDLGQQTVQELSKKFGEDRVRFIYCDVSDEKRLKESFQEAYDVHGTLDIVVNNAGIASANHRKVIEVNLIAVINGCFFAEELMTKKKRNEKGVIINTASVAGLQTTATFVNSNYFASKYGVVGLTKSLPISSDNFSKELRVAAICPSVVLTSIFKSQDFTDYDTMQKLLEPYMKAAEVDISVVVDGFILAIEDDSLNGAIITTTHQGVEVVSKV